MTGIRVVHVPYKGNPPAVTDLVGGHIQLMFVAIPSVHAQITAGRVRAIAVSSARRSAALPGVKQQLARQGAEPAGGSAEDYAKYIRTEIPRWAKVVREAGIRAD